MCGSWPDLESSILKVYAASLSSWSAWSAWCAWSAGLPGTCPAGDPNPNPNPVWSVGLPGTCPAGDVQFKEPVEGDLIIAPLLLRVDCMG